MKRKKIVRAVAIFGVVAIAFGALLPILNAL